MESFKPKPLNPYKNEYYTPNCCSTETKINAESIEMEIKLSRLKMYENFTIPNLKLLIYKLFNSFELTEEEKKMCEYISKEISPNDNE